MVRGTLANIRLRNQLAPGTEGGWTAHLPDGEQMYIYDASDEVSAGRRAADDPRRQGVRLGIVARLGGEGRDAAGRAAVIAESFERIHRTNLVGMGVLPLQFPAGENAASLRLTGKETFHIEGVRASLNGGGRKATVRAVATTARRRRSRSMVRVDTPQEVEYYRNGGILPYVLRQLASA